MPDFNKMHFNEELLGRLIATKITGTDCLDNNYNKKVNVKSTVDKGIKPNSFHEWIKSIKEDAKILELAIREREESQIVMKNNIKHHYDYLQVKFKIQ